MKRALRLKADASAMAAALDRGERALRRLAKEGPSPKQAVLGQLAEQELTDEKWLAVSVFAGLLAMGEAFGPLKLVFDCLEPSPSQPELRESLAAAVRRELECHRRSLHQLLEAAKIAGRPSGPGRRRAASRRKSP